MLTGLCNSDAWQCHPTTPGPWRAADVLKVRASGELPGRHAPTRQGGPGEHGLTEQPQATVSLGRVTPVLRLGLFPRVSLFIVLSLSCLCPTPRQQIHNIRQHSSTGPPPLLLAPRASVPSVQIQGQRIIQQGLIRVANVPNTSLLVNIPQVSRATDSPVLWPVVLVAPGTLLGREGCGQESPVASAERVRVGSPEAPPSPPPTPPSSPPRPGASA